MPRQFPSSNKVPSGTGPPPEAREVRCRTAPAGPVAASAHPPPAGDVVVQAEPQAICVKSTTVDAPGETPRRVPVKGLTRLAAYLRGKELLILGPGNTGKSKFARYLRLAALDPEGIREMTIAVTKSPAFVLGAGGEEGFELKVRRTVDTCGQVGPLQHALLVARRQPHAVIVLLDCSVDPRSMLRWLCLFCDALDSVLREVPSAHRRLQEIMVILNKRDKIDDREFAKLRQAVRKALERFLTVVWSEERVRSIPILECISVRTARGTALIDRVIAQLTERLARRQDQPGAAVGPRLVVLSPAGPRPGPARPSSPPVARQGSAGRRGWPAVCRRVICRSPSLLVTPVGWARPDSLLFAEASGRTYARGVTVTFLTCSLKALPRYLNFGRYRFLFSPLHPKGRPHAGGGSQTR